MSAKTATQVGGRLGSMRGVAYLYRLSEPLEGAEYVIVSAIDEQLSSRTHVLETYIFPADASGKVADWGELPGSIKGSTDHTEALLEAGYEATA